MVSNEKQFSVVSDIYDEGMSWQYRIVRASIGTTVGLIVLAMLGKQPKFGPALGKTCNILKDGSVMTMVREVNPGKIIVPPQYKRIGSTIDVRDNLRRLADHCKLNDADRTAMFEEFSKWILKDERATSEI